MAVSSVSISQLLRLLVPEAAAARVDEEDSLSDWERVYLPIDPGVVLLDIAFVPDDFNHGSYFFLSYCLNSHLVTFLLLLLLTLCS